jgi:membrane fusion protein (multidrug efflux system)
LQFRHAPLWIAIVGTFFIPALYAEAQPRPGGGNAPAAVIVSEARIEPFVERVEALGTLRANETVVLTAKTTDSIRVIHFNDGQRVEKGAVLVEMTNEQQAAELDEERANVSEAKKQLDRIRTLRSAGTASQTLLDQRQREYSAALARLRGVESRLNDRLITAPFSGVVGLRDVSVGALLQPGTRITTLDDDSVMKMDFSVPELFMPDLQIGLRITALSRAFNDQKFSGEIASIDSQIDPVTRSVIVRAILPNEEKVLKPGLLMNVVLEKNPRESIIIPEEAIIPEGRDNYVLIVDAASGDPVAKRVQIKLGGRLPGKVEVLNGLEAGDMVITHGTTTTRPGQKIRIMAVDDGTKSLKDMLNSADKKG